MAGPGYELVQSDHRLHTLTVRKEWHATGRIRSRKMVYKHHCQILQRDQLG